MNIEQLKKELGLKIKSFRTSRNYTQEKFCELINLEQPNLSNIENGKNFPDIITIFTILEKTGMEPNFLFSFLDKNKIKHTRIDYEIMYILLNLPEELKIKIKNIIEIIK